ncbi:hypothetical protein H7849_24375 [Alloacidobacterium dinghuense]|uniref:Uncharacterized protein n=1 Tax=Alloacidobacterium dinghuense TaxID=2763107 RepID=A0A7G8BHS5_9BACT|nr:hypothetical protein [Alloacidobacterium dinghuense]QNI32095.1 hypothetical protein H7849_24375 [Alloacidobacterium dinghuense]
MPEFRFKSRTTWHNGKHDRTEVDMRLDQLMVEVKLMESDFQSARFDLISRYRDLERVFDLSVPQRKTFPLSANKRVAGGIRDWLFVLRIL